MRDKQSGVVVAVLELAWKVFHRRGALSYKIMQVCSGWVFKTRIIYFLTRQDRASLQAQQGKKIPIMKTVVSWNMRNCVEEKEKEKEKEKKEWAITNERTNERMNEWKMVFVVNVCKVVAKITLAFLSRTAQATSYNCFTDQVVRQVVCIVLFSNSIWMAERLSFGLAKVRKRDLRKRLTILCIT